MSLAALGVCASAIYTFFLLWGLLQERLSSHLYPLSRVDTGVSASSPSISSLLASGAAAAVDAKLGAGSSVPGDRFSSPLFLNALQSLFCAVVAALYLITIKRTQRPGRSGSVLDALGLRVAFTTAGAEEARKAVVPSVANGSAKDKVAANGHAAKGTVAADGNSKSFLPPLLSRYLSISLSQSLASQLGFLALAQGLSYPTMTLAKSCKLVPVLLMNVILYRRKFAPYKYVVVALVTIGISMFMLYGQQKKLARKAPNAAVQGNTFLGLVFLTANLALDGATNSTQDEVFSRYTISGPQMMLAMNSLSFCLFASALLLPMHQVLVAIPLLASALARLGLVSTDAPAVAAATSSSTTQLASAIHFMATHDQALRDVLAYAAAGALGQIAIFETLERFGSLTLVSITVTRKLFTMLLSVFTYNHRLTPLQWLGTAIVFTGIGVEAREKRREGLARKVVRDEKKALAKDA
ncbi:UAA transporter [Tilletiaria anomala UBC 951]|uniref:UDP-galactose transporter homolog 1 n=1 Tax=Tilletiaria anomala (strain ATCC 24038 / CBS 436.72 / UBC 951) TaxID=1037660 RepID=A0A066W6W1_TILAU|nr:UAA transporter [Tilletiaria anomala UBC 951]KDN46804.1 UAA transporter [Tilletiaria anomala UBC 951]